MMKKVFSIITLFVLLLTLGACGDSKKIRVTFESNGGSSIGAIILSEPKEIAEFDDPVKEGYFFTGWFTDKELTKPFDFATKISESIKLYAGWTQQVAVRFNTKTSASVPTVVLGNDGGTVNKPADPQRSGYRFGGWFYGKPGLTTYEPAPVEFPLTVTKSTTLYAYWEPINSKAVTYSKGETYTSTLQSSSALILNPLVYQWSHEDTLIDMLVTPLYSTEVDWDKAIEEGVADYYGDFSKILAAEYSIEALDYRNIKVGAAKYPVDSKGDEHLTPDGTYDREGATKFKDKEWTIEIRPDLKFEDGTPITAHTFEYSLKQYLDPNQGNYRATIFYKNPETNKNGYPVLGAEEYLKGTGSWDDVGFEVISDYVFKVTFFEEVTQSAAVGFGNSLRLVHPTEYAKSLDNNGRNSKYGTPTNPYISYGSYIIKSWDANQKLVFNKNYDYVAKETINYKCQVIEIVPDLAKAYELFKDGVTNVLGLTNDYYAEFAEDPNLYKSWDGYPQYLVINTAKSKLAENANVHPTIMNDRRFRQALFYGFNRNYFADFVYAPNTATTLPIPLDTKAYIQDPLFYSQSPNHLAVLAKHGIDPETNGYIPERAIALFNDAYNDWLAEGNTGPVTLKVIAATGSTLVEKMMAYVKNSLEELFGSDRIVLNIVWADQTTTSAAQANWDFDIALSSIGFGASYGVQWQFPAISFMGALVGAGQLGLSQPYQYDPETDSNVYAPYFEEELEVDLMATYEYLIDLKAQTDPEDWMDDYQYFLDALEATEDKPAGIYRGTVADMGEILYMRYNPYDGTAAQPFPGATSEIWKIVAELEDIFLEYVPLIPTVTRSSATVYKPNVKILWTHYSSAFGWGSQRYRYLTTDPDFSQGLYNSFAPRA